jgi:hypothetical protein
MADWITDDCLVLLILVSINLMKVMGKPGDRAHPATARILAAVAK